MSRQRTFLGEPWWPKDEELDRRLRGRLPIINQHVAHVAWDRLTIEVMWPFGLLTHEAVWAMKLIFHEAAESCAWLAPLTNAQTLVASIIPPRQTWQQTTFDPGPART